MDFYGKNKIKDKRNFLYIFKIDFTITGMIIF